MTSVDLIMNQKERSSAAILSAIVISSLLATGVFINGNMNPQKAVGQAEETFGGNATFTEELEGQPANQTAATGTPTPAPTPTPAANQTAGAPPATAANVTTNVTSADIEPILESLNTAREGLQENDTQAALEAINDADGTLFSLVNEEGDQGGLAEQLRTLQDGLDTARESLHNDDDAKALEDLNAADAQVLAITQALPADEEAEDEEPEDEDEDEEAEDEE
jgi:hypothetical protein